MEKITILKGEIKMRTPPRFIFRNGKISWGINSLRKWNRLVNQFIPKGKMLYWKRIYYLKGMNGE